MLELNAYWKYTDVSYKEKKEWIGMKKTYRSIINKFTTTRYRWYSIYLPIMLENKQRGKTYKLI
jgi:hypothetical protein